MKNMDQRKVTEICYKIKRLRLAQRMSQEELADKSGVPYTTIVRIEMGAENPSIFMITKIAEVLGTTLEKIIE